MKQYHAWFWQEYRNKNSRFLINFVRSFKINHRNHARFYVQVQIMQASRHIPWIPCIYSAKILVRIFQKHLWNLSKNMFHFMVVHMQDSSQDFQHSYKNHAKNLQVQWQDSCQVFARLSDRGTTFKCHIVASCRPFFSSRAPPLLYPASSFNILVLPLLW